MKKTKRIPVAAPIYGAVNDAPLNMDMLIIAAAKPGAGPHLARLIDWLEVAQRRITQATPTNDAARRLADEFRARWPDVVLDACSMPSSMEDICQAMLHAIEICAAYQGFEVENNLQAPVQVAKSLSDAGIKGAAKRHGSVRESQRKIKRADALRTANEQIKGGALEPSIVKRLASKLGVKPDTAKRILRKSGHLPAARRNRSP